MIQQERPVSRHRGLKVFVLLCALMMIALPAMAARGGSGAGKGGGGGTTGGGTVSINEVAPYHFGQTITFAVSAPGVAQPYVLNQCRQNGTVVSSELHGIFDGYIFGQWFTLGPTGMWTSGAADCTAQLMDYSGRKPAVLASTSFHVYA
jgi:hypothetical protein